MIAVTVKTIGGNTDKGRVLFRQIDEDTTLPTVSIEIDDKRASLNAVDLVRTIAALTGIKVEQT